jgi:hypothetical protein
VKQTYLFDLDGCKSGRSRLPHEDCKVHGKIRFTFNSKTKEFRFHVDDGSYILYTLFDTSDPYVFVADLGKGTKLQNFLVQTHEESSFVFVAFHPCSCEWRHVFRSIRHRQERIFQ